MAMAIAMEKFNFNNYPKKNFKKRHKNKKFQNKHRNARFGNL
jgi:hypothetical protein